jgi:hypothetical protein
MENVGPKPTWRSGFMPSTPSSEEGVDPSRFYRYLRRVSEWLIFSRGPEINLRGLGGAAVF